MATQNATETLTQLQAQWASDEIKQSEALAELQQALDLPEPPVRIECYDISTLQGTNTVGSMVVFAKGIPRKSDYRRFKIKAVEGQDDFASMQEMLRRRFKRMAALNNPQPQDRTQPVSSRQSEADESWAVMPNLVIIDGGKGQLNAVLEVLDELGLREVVSIIGLAKKEEEIFFPGQAESLRLPRNSPALHLIQRVRDEAHRFGVTYHRKLRGKQSLHSSLDDVPGIGPKRRQALMKKFGSIKAMREASVNELAATPGMTRKAAETLKETL